MSTQINVTVGSGGLSDKARQLQTAARQAQLEKERQQRLEAEGTEQRNAKLQAEGRAPDGTLLYGPGFKQPEIERRPAASRSGGQGLNLGHLWFSAGPGSSSSQLGIFPQFAGSTLLNRVKAANNEYRFAVGVGASWTSIPHGNYAHPDFPTDTGSEDLWNQPEFVTGLRNVRTNLSNSQSQLAFALPAGKGNFIFVFCDASAWNGITASIYHVFGVNPFPAATFTNNFEGATPIGYSEAAGYNFSQTTNRVYVCNNQSFRQIEAPSIFSAILGILNPSASVFSVTGTINGQAFTRAVSGLQSPPAGTGYILRDNDRGFSSALQNAVGVSYTPAVFEALRYYYDFISYDAFKPYPAKLKWGFLDESEGAYKNALTFDDAYASAEPLYHALWGNANEIPDRRVWDPEFAYLNLPPPKRISKATVPVSARPSSDGYNVSLLTVWDWDDPNYCRTMCKALGFTDADLAP